VISGGVGGAVLASFCILKLVRTLVFSVSGCRPAGLENSASMAAARVRALSCTSTAYTAVGPGQHRHGRENRPET